MAMTLRQLRTIGECRHSAKGLVICLKERSFQLVLIFLIFIFIQCHFFLHSLFPKLSDLAKVDIAFSHGDELLSLGHN